MPTKRSPRCALLLSSARSPPASFSSLCSLSLESSSDSVCSWSPPRLAATSLTASTICCSRPLVFSAASLNSGFFGRPGLANLKEILEGSELDTDSIFMSVSKADSLSMAAFLASSGSLTFWSGSSGVLEDDEQCLGSVLNAHLARCVHRRTPSIAL
uniref:Putative secreted protein n=1 Tax=Ixodes ricinus TaxID=34613 RepID=A0A6B0UVZ7_IXORI